LALTTDVDWPHLIFSVGAGVGVLLIGIGILIVCRAVAASLRRLDRTLDEVDRQLVALSAPVAETLSHVGGIADTADATVARLSAVVGTLETLASSAVKASTFANAAIAPAIVNVGATLTGFTAGVRRFLDGKHGADVKEREESIP
jgi:hypothetical protein